MLTVHKGREVHHINLVWPLHLPSLPQTSPVLILCNTRQKSLKFQVQLTCCETWCRAQCVTAHDLLSVTQLDSFLKMDKKNCFKLSDWQSATFNILNPSIHPSIYQSIHPSIHIALQRRGSVIKSDNIQCFSILALTHAKRERRSQCEQHALGQLGCSRLLGMLLHSSFLLQLTEQQRLLLVSWFGALLANRYVGSQLQNTCRVDRTEMLLCLEIYNALKMSYTTL